MTRARRAGFLSAWALLNAGLLQGQTKRLVVIKVDGLPEELLEQNIDRLPWIRHIFIERGAWVRNFYVRGISLSAPSWSLLDTGQHEVIRGNAEFNRFVPRVYDYLNFFPFYVGYARSRRVDMPAVEVLDQAGIPLMLDHFPKDRRYQSMQLFQRGVRWETLARSLRSKVARPVKNLIDEWQTGFDMGEGIERQQERELIAALRNPRIDYLDYFTGNVDHTLHLTSDPASQLAALRSLDAAAGRIWTAIEASPRGPETVLAMVSDHGMNSTPGTYSQGYSLVGFFNSAAGGGHHVVSTRHPRSEYKLRGLDPFVSAVVTPSDETLYLRDEKDSPTALLDLDGNERASVQLRNSDLNELQILWRQLGRDEMDKPRRQAIREGMRRIVDRNRAKWSVTVAEVEEELAALRRAIDRQRASMDGASRKSEDARRQA
ncbi:MAG: alkaline phosphatase family protein, partial [Acidobacteriota bacterium]